MTTLPRIVLLSLALLGSASAEMMPWARLKIGMTTDETITLLGDPISSRRGHGFVTWIYDNGAEVLLHATGSVVGWTAPTTTVVIVRSTDIWSHQPTGKYYATMHAVLPRKVKPASTPAPVAPTPATERATGGTTYEQLIRG